MTNQSIYQRIHRHDGLCVKCKKKRAAFCTRHVVRELLRKRPDWFVEMMNEAGPLELKHNIFRRSE